jgi:hypothetical protein
LQVHETANSYSDFGFFAVGLWMLACGKRGKREEEGEKRGEVERSRTLLLKKHL